MKLTKRSVIALKIEATQGTDATPTAAENAKLVEDLKWSPANERMAARNPVRATFGELKKIYAGHLLEVSFTMEIKGSGVVGTAPEMGDALKACGFQETITADTSVEYLPATTGQKSCTIYVWEDGDVIKLTGCMGKVTFDLSTGSIGKASFTFTGHQSGNISAIDVPAASYSSIVPVPLIGVAFSLGGALDVSKLTVDMGITVATPDSMSSTDGYGDIYISDRNVTGSIDPLAKTADQKDYLIDWKNGAESVLTTGGIGDQAGNIYTISMPKVYNVSAPKAADRNGQVTRDISLAALPTAGDDEFSLLFT
ncbi:hypothetical protein MSP8886_01439 [Marinomonas spartinae]|uniref:Uncharacterized protein n=1 Tax=Marinomonas spartinae TaxID=1792290 RepID=A0A1A8T9G3_9GAMM|nr:phage tail tube protein [Marinomonas spartinae]SBS29103.1 hypothetical protein MSP8886_01439 [Marinomonas spartinae]